MRTPTKLRRLFWTTAWVQRTGPRCLQRYIHLAAFPKYHARTNVSWQSESRSYYWTVWLINRKGHMTAMSTGVAKTRSMARHVASETAKAAIVWKAAHR